MYLTKFQLACDSKLTDPSELGVIIKRSHWLFMFLLAIKGLAPSSSAETNKPVESDRKLTEPSVLFISLNVSQPFYINYL